MKVFDNSNDKVKEYEEVLSLIEKNIRYLEAIGVDKSKIDNFRMVFKYLDGKNDHEIYEILSSKRTKKKQTSTQNYQLTDSDIKKLNNSGVKKLVTTPKLTRTTLERIATVRFNVPKGSLPMLRTRDALIQKILTLLSHEDTHEVISRVVLGNNSYDISENDKN
ncbi:hypothetical protein ABEH45_002795 [Yersinia enterocolitica]